MRINDTSPKASRIDPRTVADALGARIEAPILFSGEMVRALLDGRKTQTRRIEKRPRLAKLRRGDWLWVRETWRLQGAFEHNYVEIGYRSGVNGDDRWKRFPWGVTPSPVTVHTRWKPSIHMPRWASRLTLELTEDPRTERLHSITEADAQREGVEYCGEPGHDDCFYRGTVGYRCSFERLWKSLHGPDSWAANPEVLVLTFRRVEE